MSNHNLGTPVDRFTSNLDRGTRQNHKMFIVWYKTGSVSDPDPDPYQEALIWIDVAPKINQNHGINKSKWFVNVLFT